MTQTIPPIVQTLVEAANAGSMEHFLSCFTSDGAVDDWGREFRGLTAIRGWSQTEFIGVQVSLDVLDVAVEGAIVTLTARVGGNGYNGASHFSFAIDGDRVALMKIRA